MKKLILLSLLFAGGRCFAQTLDDVNHLMDKHQYANARVAIDKYLADPKNAQSSEGYYYKGRVYNSLSHDSTVSPSDAYAYKLAAFDAFQKSQQYDKLKDIRMQAEGYRSYLDLYGGFYDLGAQNFSRKDFAASRNAFSRAQDVENFIISKNYTYPDYKLSSIDTLLLINQAVVSLQLADTAAAVTAYRKIVDANISGPDYVGVYEFLATRYADKGDAANLQTILAKGKTAYPDDKLWNELEVENLSRNGDRSAMFSKYEELYQKDPNDYTNTYNYAAEMFNSMYGKDAPEPTQAQRDKLTQILKSAIANEGTHNDATMLMTNHLYNDAAALTIKATNIKGTKPEDIRAKKDMKALSDSKFDEMIPYGEKAIARFRAQPTLTTRQKVDYRTIAETMSDAYSAKGDQKKSEEYDKVRDSIQF